MVEENKDKSGKPKRTRKQSTFIALSEAGRVTLGGATTWTSVEKTLDALRENETEGDIIIACIHRKVSLVKSMQIKVINRK